MSNTYIVPIAVFFHAQTSWLVSFSLSRLDLKNQFAVLVAGVICLLPPTIGSFFIFRGYFKQVDFLMYGKCTMIIIRICNVIDSHYYLIILILAIAC